MTLIQPRRGTSLEWTSADPVLASGEVGFETDTGKTKRGDGASLWSELDYDVSMTEIEAKFPLTSRQLSIANNCYGSGSSAGTLQTTPGTSRVPHEVGSTATDLRVIIGNGYTDIADSFKDKPSAASIAVRAALEIGGVVYPLTFGGLRDVTIDGGGFATSDPLPVTVTQGDVIHSRTYTSSTAWWATKRSVLNNGASGGFASSSDLTDAGAGSITDGAAWQLAPMAIVGTVDRDSVSAILIGDSIFHGYADGSDTAGYCGRAVGDLTRGGGGYGVRGLSNLAGVVNLAISGDASYLFIDPQSHNKRLNFARYATTAVIEYGRNDCTGSRAYTATGSNVVDIARKCKQRGLKVVATTVTPKTTSTDGWITSGNQALDTTPTEAIRVQYNTWLRAGAPINPATFAAVAVGTPGSIAIGNPAHPIDKVWDVTALAETALNSSLWKPAQRSVTDAAMSHTVNSTNITSATANFTSADIGKSVAVLGAGSGGAVFQSTIRSVSGGVATCNGGASTTVSGATCGIGVMTFDGIHPSPYGAAVLSAAVDLADLATA